MSKKFSEVFENHKEEVAKCLAADGITIWLTTEDGVWGTIKAHIAYPDEYEGDCDTSLDYSYIPDEGSSDGGQMDYREEDYIGEELQLIDDLIEFIIGDKSYKPTGFHSGEEEG